MRIEGKISEDVCMIFDEMYLQKRQEYFWGEMIGCDDEGELYKGIVCFMIVGLKESIPYVINSSPETNNDVNWLKTELLDSLEILSVCDFTNRLSIRKNIKMPYFAYRRFACGGIRFYRDIQISA